MRMVLLLCALALFAGRGPAAALAADVPQFRDYPAAATHRGPNAPVVLASPTERMFRTRLRDGARQPANFAGDFVLTAWGCGAECLMGAAINSNTGEVAWLPGSICCWGAADSGFHPIEFRSDSRLIVLSGARDEPGDRPTARFYVFDGHQFTLLASRPIRGKPAADASAEAAALCDTLPSRLAASLHPDKTLVGDQTKCGSWPGRPDKAIILLILEDAASGASPSFDLDLVVADSRSGDVVAHAFAPGSVGTGNRMDSFEIDPEPWPLAPEVPAFAIRAHHAGTGDWDGFSVTDLSLYGLDRDGLAPVLEGLVTSAANTGRQMPCGHIGQRIERRLTIGPSRHNGLADLLLDETQTDERTVPEDDRPDLCDAIEETSRNGEKASLVFDGSRYDVPKTLQFSGRGTAMWDWLGFD